MFKAALENSIRNFSSSSSGPQCNRLQGKIAIVTASTQGIGFSIAKRLAQEGAKVMISSRKENNVKEALAKLHKENLDVSGTVCHVGNFEDRKKLFAKTQAEFGGLDILVSNAAVSPAFGSLFECTEEQWDKIFDINVKSTFLLMKEALPLLQRSKSASVIIISSIAGYQAINFLGPYSVSKTALLGLNKAAADCLAPNNIRVNAIAPGVVKTSFSSLIHEVEGVRDHAISLIPLNKFADSEEIAGTAAFLASSDASYITGETIAVAGGMMSRL